MKNKDAPGPSGIHSENLSTGKSCVVSRSKNGVQNDAQADASSAIVFSVEKRSCRRVLLSYFIIGLCGYLFIPVIAHFIFGTQNPMASIALVLFVYFLCAGWSFSLLLWRLRRQRVIINNEGIDLRLIPMHTYLCWEEISHYIFHPHLILSRLDLFDHRGKRRMIIWGFFDCRAIAEAIEMMGIPQRGRKIEDTRDTRDTH